jgi:predicted TPR repeat methyltransferase
VSALVSPAETGYLVYDLHSDRLHQLNPAASLVVELCDGERSLDDLHEILQPLVGDEGWTACRTWIDAAIDDGLIAADKDADPPVNAKQLTARANELWEDDDVLAAFVCQERAASLEPEDPAVWYTLGELAQVVGRRSDARHAYERYLDKRPDDAEIAHLLIALRGDPAPARASDECIEQLYARFASFYDETMTGDLEYRAPELLRCALADALRGRTDLDVLDLGCGTGLAGQQLRSLARRLIGVDLSPTMIDQARARRIYDALDVDELAAYLRRGHTRFDVIAACDTLIYFGDLAQVIEPAAQRLRAHAAIAFTTERGDVDPFVLTDSGRFSHHPNHIRAVAAAAGLVVARLDDEVLRFEYGRPVRGLVAVLQMPSA